MCVVAIVAIGMILILFLAMRVATLCLTFWPFVMTRVLVSALVETRSCILESRIVV